MMITHLIENNGQEFNMLPVHSTVKLSPTCNDILIVPDSMSASASVDGCTFMSSETEFCGDMPIADPTDVIIQNKVASHFCTQVMVQ